MNYYREDHRGLWIGAVGVFTILFCLSFCTPADAKPRPTPIPILKAIPVQPELVCRTKQKDLELRDWIDGVLNELHKAQGDLIAANKSNSDTLKQLDDSKRDATLLAQQCASDHQCAQHPLSCWFKRTMKHLIFGSLILGAAVIALFIFAPGVITAIGSFFSLAGGIVSRLLERIRSLFKAKT